jgi:hypothetical protein
MRRDEVSRNRSVLLARWRDASAVRERGEGDACPAPAPSSRDDVALLDRLEAEIRRSVPRSTADTLCRILAAPRAGASELSPEIRAAILSKLDLVEDVLDAVLLAGGRGDAAEKEPEPP